MIDPKSVLVTCATHDGKVEADFAGGLARCGGLYAGMLFVPGISNVMLARCKQADLFLCSPFDVMVSIDADIGFTRQDFEYLMEGEEDIVAAEYTVKDGSGRAAQRGLGFARIHRRVFEKILTLTLADVAPGIDASEEELSAPVIQHMNFQGVNIYEFFPTCAVNGVYQGEDHAFFNLAYAAKCTLRDETRTRLIHWGRKAFVYPSAESIAAGAWTAPQ